MDVPPLLQGNFYNSLYKVPSEKGLSKREEFASYGSKFFSFKVTPFQKRGKTILNIAACPESQSILFIICEE